MAFFEVMPLINVQILSTLGLKLYSDTTHRVSGYSFISFLRFARPPVTRRRGTSSFLSLTATKIRGMTYRACPLRIRLVYGKDKPKVLARSACVYLPVSYFARIFSILASVILDAGCASPLGILRLAFLDFFVALSAFLLFLSFFIVIYPLM